MTKLTRNLGLATATTALSAAAFADAGALDNMQDDMWIGLSGNVTSVSDDQFEINYGEGSVTVSTDAFDEFNAEKHIDIGDEIRVHGQIDEGLFTHNTLNAYAVSVDGHDHILAQDFSNSGEEALDSDWIAESSVEIGEMEIVGTVTSASSWFDSFTVSTTGHELNVDFSEMSVDLLDEESNRYVSVGDRVRVSGELDRDLFTSNDLVAENVTILSES